MEILLFAMKLAEEYYHVQGLFKSLNDWRCVKYNKHTSDCGVIHIFYNKNDGEFDGSYSQNSN